MHIIIHTDGGSRGNPGPAASAFTVHSPQNEVIHEASMYLGVATNNVAEYTALRMSMEWVLQNKSNMDISQVDIVMDSELVVKQMRGEYKIKDITLQKIAAEVKRIEKDLSVAVTYAHVRRAENARADELVNQSLDTQKSS